MISQEDSIDEDGTKAITNTTTTMKMDADESEKKNDEEDPARLVYQRREVAEAFVNIRDTIPLGKEQMDTMIRIIRYFQPTTTTKPPNLRWLDLGCGDGPLSQRLLEEFPTSNGLLVDHSQPMLDLARSKLAQQNDDKIQFQLGDFNNDDFLKNDQKEGNFDIIVSRYAIHHVSQSRKKILYQQIFDLLTPGGIFLNMEHVESPTTDLESIFESAFCDSMYETYKSAGKLKARSEIESLVGHDLSVDSQANILAPVGDQCQWLRDIGFVHVDCYFKFFILALFGGVKPPPTTNIDKHSK